MLRHAWLLLILATQSAALQAGRVRPIPPPHENCGLCALCVGLDEVQTAKLNAEAAAAKKKWKEEWKRSQRADGDKKAAAPRLPADNLQQNVKSVKISESKVAVQAEALAKPSASPWAVFRKTGQ